MSIQTFSLKLTVQSKAEVSISRAISTLFLKPTKTRKKWRPLQEKPLLTMRKLEMKHMPMNKKQLRLMILMKMRKKKLKRGLKNKSKKRREVAENNKHLKKKKNIEDNQKRKKKNDKTTRST